MKKKLILPFLIMLIFLTSCATYVSVEKDGKKVTATSPTTGQRLAKNIVCQVDDKDFQDAYASKDVKKEVDVTKLQNCDDLKITDGVGHGFWDLFLIYPLAWLFMFLGKLTGNYGVAIILATLIIRAIMWPLTAKGSEQQIKQQELQPKVARINEKYKGVTSAQANANKQAEIQKLYKQNGINPLAGCIPALVQFPLLIAFYNAIYRLPALYYDTFLGFDLAVTPMAALSTKPMGFLYLLFVVLNGASSYASMALTMHKTKKTRKTEASSFENSMNSTMKFMPIMTAVISLTLPVAISIYWITGNLVQILQTYIAIKKHDAELQKKL